MKAGQNETLSSGSGSSPSSTLLTSPPSKTPSNAPPVTIIEVPKDAIKVVLQTQPEPTLGLPQIMAGWVGPVVALIAIYAVHRVTQLREKAKAAFAPHKTIGEPVGNNTTDLLTAWEDPDTTNRQAATEKTTWRLTKIAVCRATSNDKE